MSGKEIQNKVTQIKISAYVENLQMEQIREMIHGLLLDQKCRFIYFCGFRITPNDLQEISRYL